MRQVSGTTRGLIRAGALVFVAFVSARAAEAQYYPGNPYYSNHTYSYGLNLPQVPLPSGQDEVRAADGTSCRSSMSSNSAYLDMGAIGNDGLDGNTNGGTFYGRIIMPLGETPKRVDCSRLYDLEIRRLKHELELARSGAGAVDNQDFGAAPMRSGAETANSNLIVKGPPAAAKQTTNTKQTAGTKKADWAEKGWSSSGWQTPSRAGANSITLSNDGGAAAVVETQAIPVPVDELPLWETRISRPVEQPRPVMKAEETNFFSHMGGVD